MKKSLILITALLMACGVTYAQTEKGNQTLGFNLAFAYNSRSGITNYGGQQDAAAKTTSFSIGPSYSYFIQDKLDLGASVAFGTSSLTYPNAPGYPATQTSYNFGGIVYLRKYIMFKDMIGLRVGPYIGYNTNDAKYEYYQAPTQDTKTNYFNAGGRLELVYYPSKRLGLSTYLASLDYNHYTANSGVNGHQSGDNFYLNVISSGLAISVFYTFGK